MAVNDNTVLVVVVIKRNLLPNILYRKLSHTSSHKSFCTNFAKSLRLGSFRKKRKGDGNVSFLSKVDYVKVHWNVGVCTSKLALEI